MASKPLTLTPYPGDGAVLLAFSLDPQQLNGNDFGVSRERHRQIMPNFKPSSNPAKPILARLSTMRTIENYPHCYAKSQKNIGRELNSQRISSADALLISSMLSRIFRVEKFWQENDPNVNGASEKRRIGNHW